MNKMKILQSRLIPEFTQFVNLVCLYVAIPVLKKKNCTVRYKSNFKTIFECLKQFFFLTYKVDAN